MPKHLEKETLALRVLRLRKSLGLNQIELAHKVGVNTRTIQKIETELQTDVKLQNAIALAQALNVSLEYLAFGEDHLTLNQAELLSLVSALHPSAIRTLLATARALADSQGLISTVDQKKSRP